MGKSTISMAIFNSYVTNYQRVSKNAIKMKDLGYMDWKLPDLRRISGYEAS